MDFWLVFFQRYPLILLLPQTSLASSKAAVLRKKGKLALFWEAIAELMYSSKGWDLS